MNSWKILILLTLLQLNVKYVHGNNTWQNDLDKVANTILSSEEGKNLIDTLLNVTAVSGSTKMFENLVSILSAKKEASALYGLVVKTTLEVLNNDWLKNMKNLPIISDILSTFVKEVSLSNVLNFFSSIAGIADSFIKAQDFNSDHSNHDWLLPPIVEKFHLLYDLIIHSPLAKKLMLYLKESKLYKTFADESGSFSLRKFGELMENHSFRKRWIQTVSYKIAQVIVRVFDPNLRTSVLTLVQSNINNFLKIEGFPKSTFLNINELVESVSAFVNYVLLRFFGYNIQSKKQVQIIWDILKNLYDTVLFGQYFNTRLDAEHVSNTLTNILNLEIIEPVAKTYRGFRFAKKHKECDRYVMCLVNSYDPHSTTNLPVIKNFLTKVASLIGSWFLSQHTDTSYYSLIMSIIGNGNCQKAFYKSCDGFHAEEFRVKQEYTHFEL